MISTYTTTSIVSTITTPNSIITTPVSPPEIMTYSIITVVTLLIILALKLILSNETQKNKKIADFINGTNVVILPLTFVFLVSVVLYEITTIF